MTAMTPLKRLILDGTAIVTQDYADQTEIVCVANGPDQARWLLDALVKQHKVEVVEVTVEGGKKVVPA